MREKFIQLSQIDTSEKYLKDISDSEFFGFPIEPIIKAEERLQNKPSIAYFSMEFGLAPSVYHTFKTVNSISPLNVISKHEVFSNMKDMDYYHSLPFNKLLDLPIYSGGLGVLAGDSLKSAADLNISLTGIGILWHKGYFKQKFWFRAGGQVPEEISWDPDTYPGLIPLKNVVTINLSGQPLHLKLWKYYVYSNDLKNVVPLILLDANLDSNPEYFKELTAQLYRSSNAWIKIAQRMILGMGGVNAYNSLKYSIKINHLNEGHAAFAFVEKAKNIAPDSLKSSFAYTCHTPVEAGHDRFDLKELSMAIGNEGSEIVKKYGRDLKNSNIANLTQLAMSTSAHINAVAQKHGEVTRLQFPQFKDKIQSITNGIHTFTWLSHSFKELFDKYQEVLGNWQADPTLLKNVVNLRNNEAFRKDLWSAHQKNKENLAKVLEYWYFNANTFTIGWARRIAPYKRPSMLLQDPNRLIDIARRIGQLQIVIAGKAHPADVPASIHMDEMLEKITLLNGERKLIRICFLENYDTYFGKLLTNSVDVWLNNPLPPFEASGTSGMKAILNGVPQLSTLDGWVVEAADKGIGKIFGYVPPPGEIGSERDLKLDEDSKALYKNLEEMVTTYYAQDSSWVDMMINCIEQSAFFSTHRMIREYNEKIWQAT
ncbi:MAG: alpha-glucan family phosphorylase [Candidatus Margulisbacteria bacterium]|nr:alpha-glucan family phosphorylase [Candidatus Margulisiibacteriota bacterium]MBU1616826.1 alpha-glucan family phosphorylase [Candidatus Margulisiibacteriota bacterium]MBU1935619.1 alpha-glucan family phosphorylase [Patescibacteria group bacterium]